MTSLTNPIGDLVLLDEAGNGTAAAQSYQGGAGLWTTWGTFGGATVTLQMSPDGGTTWLDTNATATSAGGEQVTLPACMVRAVVSGGSGASISSKLMGV